MALTAKVAKYALYQLSMRMTHRPPAVIAGFVPGIQARKLHGYGQINPGHDD
jgi:hypothetical protein